SFLQHDVFGALTLDQCEALLQDHPDDIWTNRIKSTIDDKRQNEVDQKGYGQFEVEKIKGFLTHGAIVSAEDFFIDVAIRLEKLAKKIEDNRDNERNLFYNGENKKTENECRDIVRVLLSEYNSEWSMIREGQEADNRVDINIKYKLNDRYEVQVE